MKTQTEIEEIYSNMSLLWIISAPVYYVPVLEIPTTKDDVKFCFEVLGFKICILIRFQLYYIINDGLGQGIEY